MPFSNFGFRKLLAKLRKSCTSSPTPPPYSPSPYLTLGIEASDVPQWIWSNAQCRTWITAVCRDLLGFSYSDAKEVASNFNGFGPRLYAMDWVDWKSLLGEISSLADAQCIYALVFGQRREKGAVPTGTICPHMNRVLVQGKNGPEWSGSA